MSDLTILLVDDVDFFLEVEKGFLKQTAGTILVARNGQEALDLARRHHPDLIFMDVNMPVMDGLTCCRKLKDDPELARIPVIMVFAPSREVTETACLDAGCDGVICKPVDRNLFLGLGRRFLYSIDRRERRIPCQMTVDFNIDGQNFQGMGQDIGKRGCYVQFRTAVGLDARIKAVFFLPSVSSMRIEVSGRVAWVNQGFPRPNLNLPQGFGIEFRMIAPEAVAVIQDYLEMADPPQSQRG